MVFAGVERACSADALDERALASDQGLGAWWDVG